MQPRNKMMIAASTSRFLPVHSVRRAPGWLISALVVLLLAGVAPAQRGGFGFGGHGGFGGAGFGRGFAHERGGAVFGYPFLYDDYYVSGSMASLPGQPIVIVQPSSVAASAPEPKADPLMIELQGDHYVRVSGQTSSSKQPAATLRSEPTPQGELPPAVLVYRDGHTEQVSDYVIANGTLYSRADYWEQGSWTRNIQLSALDLRATIATNQASGVKFVLPSGPYEVVTRP
jgi:hypothetical protein